MKARISELIQRHYLQRCLECGKCSAVCPMLDFYGEYTYERSPRGVVERLSFDPGDIDNEEALWYCLTCRECTFYCPSGIHFQDFMMALRDLLIQNGHREHAVFCEVCGGYLMPKKELEYLQKGKEDLNLKDLLTICPVCKKGNYAATLHRVAPIRKHSKRLP